MPENLAHSNHILSSEADLQAATDEQVLHGLKHERYDFGPGEILRFTPETIRDNEATGEPVSPILYVQGMNGNDKLPDMMTYLAEQDQRPVIAIRYHGKATISPKPVKPGMRGYRADATIPELDVHRADDLLGALSVFDDVHQVSIVAESAGAVRALLAADTLSKNNGNDVIKTGIPVVNIDSVLLVDPAGQDGRSYSETHFDALRLARSEKQAAKLGALVIETIADTPQISTVTKQRRDRPEQRAVAFAQVQAILAEVSERLSVRILSDVSDEAFRTDRIAEQMESSGAIQHAELIQTDKGGHGVGLNKAALDSVIANLRELETLQNLKTA